ncbi:hypothetical protein [Streptomyces endophytica]|uniref:Rad50/SbcC-type AAA domain-containing protein n=1 Tax=Streptomyces endophytica TaxID=2991496 RepID=A0ABY6PIZ8_9ACTN|nr:hypothetical protein [Streptomyces endophytica]UZJ33786.1 hypothetical protein OJ254_30405 [Streptomyces endophytica]
MDTGSVRPAVTELRLSAFKTHRGINLPLGPLTLLSGESGSGKSSALQAYEILARLGSGESLARAVRDVAGSASACVPAGSRPDEQGRRGFRIGCTVDGPAGPVDLDLAVQAEPELRIVGERLTGGGETLLTTALTDPARPAVQAAWHTAGAVPVTRAPLPDDLLGTSLLPLRVAGKTEGQRLVLAAAEQVVVALRSAFVCDPRPEVMRGTRAAAVAGAVGAGGTGIRPKKAGTGKASAKGAATTTTAGSWGTRARKGTGDGGEAGRWGRDAEGAHDEGGCGPPATTCPPYWSGRARSAHGGTRCWSRQYGRHAPARSTDCAPSRDTRIRRGSGRPLVLRRWRRRHRRAADAARPVLSGRCRRQRRRNGACRPWSTGAPSARCPLSSSATVSCGFSPWRWCC